MPDAFDDGFVDYELAALTVVGKFVHEIEHDLFTHGSQSTGAGVTLEGAAGDGFQGAFGEFEIAILHAEEFLILLDQGVLRLAENVDERGHIERLEGGGDGQTADEFGDHAELDQIFRLNLRKHVSAIPCGFAGGVFGVKADLAFAEAFANQVFEADKCAAADEKNL